MKTSHTCSYSFSVRLGQNLPFLLCRDLFSRFTEQLCVLCVCFPFQVSFSRISLKFLSKKNVAFIAQ